MSPPLGNRPESLPFLLPNADELHTFSMLYPELLGLGLFYPSIPRTVPATQKSLQ